MKSSFRILLPTLFWLAVVATPLRADEQLHYLPAGKPDAVTLLAPPPLPDSAEQKYDLAEVESVCHEAPSNDVAEALAQDKGVSIDYFAPDIGTSFQPGKLPKTEAFLHNVHEDAEAIVDTAKDYYKRPRPYAIDPSLAPGKKANSFSYPSGHSTESMVLALVLADLFPDKHDAIIAEARSIGWHRVEIARHYPTDIYAGRVLAQAIVREMKKNHNYRHDFAEAKAEITAVQTAKNSH